MFQVWLLQEPGILIFALFSLVGPAIVFPLRVNVALTGGMVVALFLIVRFTFPIHSTAWVTSALLFATLMAGFAMMGVVLRRFVRQFAHTTVASEREAAQCARLEQQMHDLHQEADRLASLEHDLRQPLRAIQGYLTLLRSEPTSVVEAVPPAIAAAQRAERLVNNLLDQRRVETQRHGLIHRRVDLDQFFAALQQTAFGLVRYYTDPPIPIIFMFHDLPTLLLDDEKMERALLNLLDNALVHSPPDGMIEVRAWGTSKLVVIEVQDHGPGIPTTVIQSILQETACVHTHKPRLGLGLLQTYAAVKAHNGSLSFPEITRGTIVRITLPCQGPVR